MPEEECVFLGVLAQLEQQLMGVSGPPPHSCHCGWVSCQEMEDAV